MKLVIMAACLIVANLFESTMLIAQDAILIQAARREGRVVWYTVAGESQQLAQDFEKKYPFMKIEVVRSTVYPLLTRILNESRAGNYLFDVVRQSTFTIGLLIQKGLVQPYDSPERKGYNAGWKDKQAYWTSTDDNYFVVGYNTRLVSEREAPKDGKTSCFRNGADRLAWIPTITYCSAALSKDGEEKKRWRISAN